MLSKTLNLQPVERIGTADRACFEGDYLAARRPVVLRDLAADWPALRNWTPASLSERFGGIRVPVYDASFASPGGSYMSSIDRMPFSAFLEAIFEGERDLRMFLYNIASELPELADDVRLPALPLRFSRRFLFTFFGCRGAVTPMHYDIDMGHVFYTAVHGRREISLYPRSESTCLYRHPFTVRSYIDLAAPDWEAFPALSLAQGYRVMLEPGETLFIPSGYWHEFRYADAGYGISLRTPSERWPERLEGLANLAITSPIDRLCNRLAPRRWFDWKTRQARRRVRALGLQEAH